MTDVLTPGASPSTTPLTRPNAYTRVRDPCDALSDGLRGALRRVTAQQDASALRKLREAAALLAEHRMDACLYHLIHEAARDTRHYSSRHSLLSALIAETAAKVLGWPAAEVQALSMAALSMNVGMCDLQDQLAQSDLPLNAEMRVRIARHADDGRRLLAEAGVDDEAWLEAVSLHHSPPPEGVTLADLSTGARLAALLRRVDIFTAKLSRRGTRQPMSPVKAAGQACLGANGQPDELGAALLKSLGLYPPGSLVQLQGGEMAIVAKRGARVDQPWVAVLVAPDGIPCLRPLLRDTGQANFTVKSAAAASALTWRPAHEVILEISSR